MCYEYEYPEETEIVTFNRSDERGIWGYLDGIKIIVDRFHNPGVEMGDTWHCRLCRRQSECGYYFFAMPVEKINPPRTHIAEEVSPIVSTPAVSSKESDPTGDDSSDDRKESSFSDITPLEWCPLGPDLNSLTLCAMGDDRIHAEFMGDGRYSVYCSPKGSVIQFVSDPAGPISFDRGDACIEGLDNVVGGVLPRVLRYENTENGILVSVTQRNRKRREGMVSPPAYFPPITDQPMNHQMFMR